MRLTTLIPALLIAVACEQPAGPPIASSPPAIVAAPVESAAPAPSVHDLSIDERRGGHTLARHVGRTDQELRERLRRDSGISAASTYTDRPTAERVVAAAFDESRGTLSRWTARTGRRPNLVLDRDEPSAIGRTLRRGQRTATDCDHAVVVLRWDDAARSSYVLTSYPECRR